VLGDDDQSVEELSWEGGASNVTDVDDDDHNMLQVDSKKHLLDE
jgi:hypothetical protein